MNLRTRTSPDCSGVVTASLAIALFLLMPHSTYLLATQGETERTNGRRERGFVFLDSRYLAPPYVIELKDDSLTINDRELRMADLDLSVHYTSLSKSEILEHLYHELNSTHIGIVVVLFQNRKPMLLRETREGERLITVLARSHAPHQGDDEIPATLRFDVDRVTWAQLVSEFQPSPEFLTRANEHLAHLEEVHLKNTNSVTRNVWVGRIQYPLTTFAMLIVALAFGHLMSTKPCAGSDTASTADSPSPQRAVCRSLLIVGILSVVDLIWTFAAADSGSMRELNPLGSHLIDCPLELVAFKSGTTIMSIGLLYWFHRYPIAQVASWWSCLVLTLVTARWLTFSSMYL